MSAPLLPGLSMHLWGQHLGWALVLAALVGAILSGMNAPVRRSAMAFAAIAALVPGTQGPVFWIALAYQIPSLTSMALALWWLWGEAAGHRGRIPTGVWAGAAVLGVLLLLDTLALLPWTVYAMGFDSGPFMVWLVLSALVCVWPHLRSWGWAGLIIGLIFAVTRLPTGNLWDAVSDPWLGLLALGVLLRRAWHAAKRAFGR